MNEPVWLSRQSVEMIHQTQLARHGGAAGLRDAGLLESALVRALNAWSYGEADLFEFAALYAEGIAKNHPFADGNKRTAFVAAALFLRINGRRLRAENPEAVEKMLGLASGALSRGDFAAWLRERSIPA
jgi:death on curing protein